MNEETIKMSVDELLIIGEHAKKMGEIIQDLSPNQRHLALACLLYAEAATTEAMHYVPMTKVIEAIAENATRFGKLADENSNQSVSEFLRSKINKKAN